MQLIYEKSIAGRRGVRLPLSDVPTAAPLTEGLLRKEAAGKIGKSWSGEERVLEILKANDFKSE